MTGGGSHLSFTTETLVRDGGTAWKYAARLPTEIYGIKGIGFNGHFIVAGNPQSGIRVSFQFLNPNRRGLGVEKSLTFPAYK